MCLEALIPHTHLGAAKAVAPTVKLHLLWGQDLHENAVPITYADLQAQGTYTCTPHQTSRKGIGRIHCKQDDRLV